jgi:hypothetical protein
MLLLVALSVVQSYEWAYTATSLAWLQHWNLCNSNQLAFNAELAELYAKTSWKVVLEQQKQQQQQQGTAGPAIR